jgi:hypothetical protein
MKHDLLEITSAKGCLFLLLSLLSGCGSSDSGESPSSSSGMPILDVADTVVAEGDNGTTQLSFTVTLSEATSDDVTVDYTTSDDTASDTTDYTAVGAGTLRINAGDTQATITIAVNGDTDIESDETLRLDLSDPRNAELGDAQAIGTIANDDFPVVNLSNASVVEGDSGTADLAFVVSLSAPAIGPVSLRYDSSNISAEAGSDYTATSGTLILPEGDVVATIVVPVNGDMAFEPDETLVLSLTNLTSNARFGISSAFGTILSDELPSVSVAPAAVTEGQSGTQALTFLVALNAPTLGPVIVDFATSDTGSANAGNDYQAISGSVTIDEGLTDASITVLVNGDVIPEANETFLVTLSALNGNAELDASAAVAVGTINDDDSLGAGMPQVRVSPGLATEGARGVQTPMVFEVSVSPIDASAPIELQYATENVAGGAVAGVDYVGVSGATLTIPAGQSSATIAVQITGDDIEEPDEAFSLVLGGITANAELATPVATGLIADDDGDSTVLPRLSISPASVVEGDSGTRDMVFQVTLTAPATSAVSVDFATADTLNPQAVAGSDYQETKRTITIPQGETTVMVAVPVFGDDVTENDEVFQVNLSNIEGDASLGNSFVFGTIVTDDPFALVSIVSVAGNEGDTGATSELIFTISLNVPVTDAVTLDYATADGTATVADNDYLAIPSTSLTIPAGATSATVGVTIIGDDENETDEQFTVQLSNLSANAEFSTAVANGSIMNDDLSQGWGLPQKLDPAGDTGQGATPRLAMNDAGDAMVVWWQHQGVDSDVMNPSVRYTPGAGWGPVEEPPGALQTSVRGFDLSMDGNGEVLLLRSTGGLVTDRHVAGSGWDDVAISQEDALDARYPGLGSDWDFLQIVSNASGQAMWAGTVTNHATITENTVFNTFDPAGGWGLADLMVPDQGMRDMQLAMDAAGNALLVSAGQSQVWRYDAAVGEWLDPVTITEETFPGSGVFKTMLDPVVAMDAAGNAMVVWTEFPNTLNIVANYYDVLLGDWTGPVILDDPALGANGERPRVAMDAAGNAHVIWLAEVGSGEYNIKAKRYDVVAGWDSVIESVANPLLTHRMVDALGVRVLNGVDVPDLAVDHNGNAFVVWSQDADSDGVHTIRASRYDGSTWGAAEPISDDGEGDASIVQIAADAAGNAIAVWQQRDPTDGLLKVWSNRYTAP